MIQVKVILGGPDKHKKERPWLGPVIDLTYLHPRKRNDEIKWRGPAEDE